MNSHTPSRAWLGLGLALAGAALVLLAPPPPVLPVGMELSWEMAVPGLLLLFAALLALRIIERDVSPRVDAGSEPPAADTETQQRLRQASAVYETMTEGVIVTDAGALIRYVNPAFSQITGYLPKEVQGLDPRLLDSGLLDDAFYRDLWETLETRGGWEGEVLSRHKEGHVLTLSLSIRMLGDGGGGRVGYLALLRDIGALKAARAELEHLALYDPLTGLPNRLLFDDRLAAAIRSARRERTMLAVLTLDLDRFKHVNDSATHAEGDALLRQVAGRLSDCMRDSDTLARLGGDTYLVLLDRVRDAGDVALVARKLMTSLRSPFQVSGRELPVTACIGTSLFPADGDEPSLLIRNADSALHRAKETGSGNFAFYSPELTEQQQHRTCLESDLHHALSRGQLRMEYLPRYRLADGRMTGLEALPRWHHPRLGVLMPEQFLPVAEETRLIEPVGTWLLESACRDLAALHRAGFEELRVSVPLFPAQLRSEGFVDLVKGILQHASLARGGLVLDLNEQLVVHDPERSLRALHRLRALGIRLSVAGFGTAPASLMLLKRLPIDHLKLSPELLRGLPGDQGNAAICNSVNDLAHRMDLGTLAQGIERPAQRDFLCKIGCDEAQGPLLAKPRPLAELLASMPALQID